MSFCVEVVVERVACECAWGCLRLSCCPLSPEDCYIGGVVLDCGRCSLEWVGVVVKSCRGLASRCRVAWVVVVVGC